MPALPLARMSTLIGYAEVFDRIGAPVEAGLRRASLPAVFGARPDGWVSYRLVRAFVADMAAREGAPEIGILGGQTLVKHLHRGLAHPVMTAPTLHQALALIPQIVKFQNTASRFWLAVSGNRVQFCATMPLSRDSPGHVIAEMSTLAAAERIVQAFAGDDFRPTRILLSARRRDLHFDLDNTYEGTPVHADQRYCAIEFPRHLLAAERWVKTQPPARSELVGEQEPPPPSFAETLAACLVAYLPEGYPHIELAADISGLKVRTLQRQLRAEGSTYSEVVDRARCRAALAWLRDSDIGLAELSLELGYSEQSAFSRAFRRWTGTTAAQYREDSARLSVPG